MNSKSLPLLVLSFIIIIILTACENSSAPDLSEVTQELTKTIKEITPKQADIEKHTIDEVDKLFKYEYLVEDLPPDISTTKLQEHMTTLGENRWDCFFIDRLENELRIHCKRHPKTYLRYLLKFR